MPGTGSASVGLTAISERQNEERYIKMLAAQRQLYSEAKAWRYGLAIAAAIVAVLGSGAVPFPGTTTVWVLLAAVAVWAIGFKVHMDIGAKQEEAARIQELFDCDLLGLDWNDALCGSKPGDRRIQEPADRHLDGRPVHRAKLADWYSNAGRFANERPVIQCLRCQEMNLDWEERLRREWGRVLWAAPTVLLATAIIVGVASNDTVPQFLLGPALFIAPLVAVSIDLYRSHSEAYRTLDHLKTVWQGIWARAERDSADDCELIRESRQLQDGIFLYRKTNPGVPDWYYNCYRRRMERAERRLA